MSKNAYPSQAPVTLLTNQTEKLARLGRRTIEIRLANRNMRARDRATLRAVRENMLSSADTLRDEVLKVNETFVINPTNDDIDYEISKL